MKSTAGEAGTTLNADDISALKNSVEKAKTDTIKSITQLLYNKGLFHSFEKKRFGKGTLPKHAQRIIYWQKILM